MRAMYCTVCGSRTVYKDNEFTCNECGAEYDSDGKLITDYSTDTDGGTEESEDK